MPPAAPSAPTSVKFSELTTTSVNVSWEAPQSPNGVLEGYRLVYEPCTPVDGEWPPAQLPRPAWHPLPPAGDPPPHRACGRRLLADKWETEAPPRGVGSRGRGGRTWEAKLEQRPGRGFYVLFPVS